MPHYKEDEYLQLSGLQHFVFCRRQWALIHLEQLWAENYLTTDGEIFHERAHNPEFTESRGDTLITRGVYVRSATLGVSGQCDILEFRRSSDGISLSGRSGLWQPYPIEYKRGKPRSDTGDAHQLCGQALCLEEMLLCQIPCGALFYGETKRRVQIEFTDKLRGEVKKYLSEMHDMFSRGYTPKVKPKKGCGNCSLKEQCLPKLMRNRSAAEYLRQSIEEESI